eukprot:snap_masked-scaffold_31-processed-gene-2.43-mRNA-1 protein AED:0.05 eAED:0.62 QI:0/-1/0/1/-1/1/1/0/464
MERTTVKEKTQKMTKDILHRIKLSYASLFLLFVSYIFIALKSQADKPAEGYFYPTKESSGSFGAVQIPLKDFKVEVHGDYFPKCHEEYNSTKFSIIYEEKRKEKLSEGPKFTFSELQTTLHTLLISLFTILCGGYHSIFIYANVDKHKKVEQQSLKSSDAAWFPITASCALFGLFLLSKKLDPEIFQKLISVYIIFVATFALASNFSQYLELFKSSDAPLEANLFEFKRTKVFFGQKLEIDIEAKVSDLFCWFVSLQIIALYYCLQAESFPYEIPFLVAENLKWILNNFLGVSFCMLALKQLNLSSYKTGAVLLLGLFFYDIFWVFFSEGIFGDNVMVKVATSIDAPIKLLFFRNQDSCGTFQYSMLGLGDIVVPGFFLSFLGKFDASNESSYFEVVTFWYVLSLIATVAVMYLFQHAQPALLYIVPALLSGSLIHAAYRGEVKKLFEFEIEESDAETSKKKDQ